MEKSIKKMFSISYKISFDTLIVKEGGTSDT